jgi:hypothetical protein
MIKYTAFILIVALRIMYNPASNAQSVIAPFASSTPLSTTTISVVPAKLISVAGSISNHTVVLNWVVGENESADQFEVEKSSDGKNFSLAALVFGTDKSEIGNYQFFEKAGKQKVLYRIKMINKNRQTEYSAVVEINPTV